MGLTPARGRQRILSVEGVSRTDRLETQPYGGLFWCEGRSAGQAWPIQLWCFDGAAVVADPADQTSTAERAAATRVDAVRRALALRIPEDVARSRRGTEDRFDIELAVRTAARSACKAPADDHSGWGSPTPGGGSLLVAAVRTNRVAVAWVGDTRCYRVHEGVCEALGYAMTSADAPAPEGVTALPGTEPNVVTTPVSAGDVLVLPSAGIRAAIPDPGEIARIMADCHSLDEACESLIVAARLRGSQGTNFVAMLGVGLEHGPLRAVDPERNPLPFLMMIRASEVIPSGPKPKELPAADVEPYVEIELSPQTPPEQGDLTGDFPDWLGGQDGLPSRPPDIGDTIRGARPVEPRSDDPGGSPSSGLQPTGPRARLAPSRHSRRSRASEAGRGGAVVFRIVVLVFLIIAFIGSALWWWPRLFTPRPEGISGSNPNVTGITGVVDVSHVADQQPTAVPAPTSRGDTYTVSLRVDEDFLNVSLGADAPGPLEVRVQRLVLGRWENIGASTLDPGKASPVFLAAGSESAPPSEDLGGTLAFRKSPTGEAAWAPTSTLGSLPRGAAVSIEGAKIYVAYRSRALLLILRAM